MTMQKPLVGNELCGIFLQSGTDPKISGFAIYFFILMFSCLTIDFEHTIVHNISLGIFGITFDINICHPWIKKINSKNCNKTK